MSTYALLDTGNESTLIRGDFMRKLKLKEMKKIVNIHSIRDMGEAISTMNDELQATDNNNIFHFSIKEPLTIERKSPTCHCNIYLQYKSLAKTGDIYRGCS